MTMLLALAVIGYLVVRSKASGGSSGGSSSSYTEARDGVRHFTNETKARILDALKGYQLAPTAQDASMLPPGTVAMFELKKGTTSSVVAETAAAMASKQGKVVCLSATMGAALDGLSTDPQFILFCQPSVKTTVAGLTSSNAILLDA